MNQLIELAAAALSHTVNTKSILDVRGFVAATMDRVEKAARRVPLNTSRRGTSPARASLA